MTTRCGAALALLLAAIAMGCGDEDDEPAATTEDRAAETSDAPAPTATTEAPAPKRKRRPAVDRREAAVQIALNELVEAYELSDQPRLCSLLGQSGANAESCAARARVDLMLLPSSEELSVEHTGVEGNRAGLQLSSGTVVSLRRTGGRWVIVGLKAP